ncbi:cystatin-like 1 isoform X2 [Ochotona princeps]|uniref:cystatin-like 1 isoform X2 n=1 Tax=Ochotona princeps TaxID=9978 RepID=UPI002714B97D|nr:cystatin-like 1 isoform X2 [Ochotona princeps]
MNGSGPWLPVPHVGHLHAAGLLDLSRLRSGCCGHSWGVNQHVTYLCLCISSLTTGVEYKVTVKIGRTKCKRNSRTNSSCPLQKKKLKKSLICESLIYTVPWINYFRMWNNSCHDN